MIQSELRKIEHILQKLGLIDSEIDIFFLGLEIGAVSIKQLAEESRMNRITVHEIVKRLIEKGLFLETYSKKKRLVYPNQIDAITRLIEKKKQEVRELEHEAKQASSILRSIQAQSEHFPKTRFYKGKEGMKIVIKELIKDQNEISIMSDGQHFYDLIDNDFLETTLELRNKKKIGVKLLFPTGFEYFSYTQGTYQQQLEIKSLPDDQLLKGGMTIWGDKIALHCYEGRFITTTLLENTQTTGILRYLYDQLWEKAKSY